MSGIPPAVAVARGRARFAEVGVVAHGHWGIATLPKSVEELVGRNADIGTHCLCPPNFDNLVRCLDAAGPDIGTHCLCPPNFDGSRNIGNMPRRQRNWQSAKIRYTALSSNQR